MITYEYPLNERIRTLLRLEDLFERVAHFIAADGVVPQVVALAGADLRDLAIAEPSLETAFIALTGRALVP